MGFGRLFGGTSSTRVTDQATASRSSTDQGHASIAATPNTHDLLRSSEQQPARSTLPQLPAERRESIHTAQPANQQGGAQVPAPSGRLSTAATQAPGQADTLGELQHVQKQPAATENATASPFAQQQEPVTYQTFVPALCQVASSAEYAQTQQIRRQPEDGLQNSHQQQSSQQAALLQQPPRQTPVLQQAMRQVPLQPQTLAAANDSYHQSGFPPASGSTLFRQQLSTETVEGLQQRLMLEAKAREELEDMLLRYERHLKAETAARQAAEQQAAAALAHAAEVRQQLVSNGRQAKQQDSHLAAEHAAMQQERAELEQMRHEFEAQLHTARNELNKAQVAMSGNEGRVRAAEAEERAQITAEYEIRLAAMMTEVDRLREELATRTHLMTAELDRWKQQVSLNTGVLDPRIEALARRHELDSTKDRMEQLLGKLYAGRDSNVALSGALAAAARNQQVLQQAYADQLLLQQANNAASHLTGRSPGGPAAASALLTQSILSGRSSGFFADDSTAGYNAPHNPQSAYATPSGSKALVPTMQKARAGQAAGASAYRLQPNSKFPPPPLILSHTGTTQQPSHQQQQQHRPAPAALPGQPPHLQQLSPRSSSRIPQPSFSAAVDDDDAISHMSSQHLPAVTNRSGPQEQQRHRSTSRSKGRHEGGSYAQLHQQQVKSTNTGGGLSPRATPVNDAFGHVVSRYAQSAAKVSKVHQAQGKKQQKVQARKLPDRFAESAKSAAMISAMASRFG